MSPEKSLSIAVVLDGKEVSDRERYSVRDGQAVELTARPGGFTLDPATVSWRRDGAEIAAAPGLTMTVPKWSRDDEGTYDVRTDGVVSKGVRLASAAAGQGNGEGRTEEAPPAESAERAEPAPPGKVVEVLTGEYSPAFSLLSGLVGAGAAAVAFYLVYLSLQWAHSRPPVNDPARALELFRFTIFAVVIMLVSAVGVIAVIGGTWMAALETRGRLRAAPAVNRRRRTIKRGGIDIPDPSELVEQAGKFMVVLPQMRGTVAAFATGMILLSMATFTSCQVAVGADSDAGATPSTSSPSTASGTSPGTSSGTSSAAAPSRAVPMTASAVSPTAVPPSEALPPAAAVPAP